MIKRSHITPVACLTFLSVITVVSCDRKLRPREYEETVIPSPLEMTTVPHGDPHGFMDMSSPMMALPPGEEGVRMQKSLEASVAKSSLTWETPSGWSEQTGSGMRLVSFSAQDGAIDCSIVTLSGEAGGLQANVARWMNQMNIPVPTDDQFNDFLAQQEAVITKGGFSVQVIDFTGLSTQGTESRKTLNSSGMQQVPMMIAAMAELPGMVIFIKMTGPKVAVVENREKFIALCRSLAF